MALRPSKTESKSNVTQEVLPVGSYPVRLVQLIDLGIQPQRPFKGEEKPPVHMISLTYEFSDEFLVDENGEDIEDKPRWLSETIPFYDLSKDKAKSTQRYNAMDPDNNFEGDFSLLLGSPCLLNLVHNKQASTGKIFENVASTSSMRKKDANKLPSLVNEPKLFLFEEPDLEVFLSLPEWLQEKIKGNLNFEGSVLESMLNGGKPVKKTKPPVEQEEETEEEDEQW